MAHLDLRIHGWRVMTAAPTQETLAESRNAGRIGSRHRARAYGIAVTDVIARGQISDRDRVLVVRIASRYVADGDRCFELKRARTGCAAVARPYERVHELAGCSIVAEHTRRLRRCGTGDVKVAVRTEGDADREVQPAARRGEEVADVGPVAIEAQHAVGRRTPNVQDSVRTERQPRGRYQSSFPRLDEPVDEGSVAAAEAQYFVGSPAREVQVAVGTEQIGRAHV